MFRTISRLVLQEMTRSGDLPFVQEDLRAMQADLANIRVGRSPGAVRQGADRPPSVRAG